MSKNLKLVWKIVSNSFVAIIIALTLLIAGVRLFGIKPYTVLSGSMEPTYHVGSLIYVKKVDPLTLKEGDPVTFMVNQNTVATHRIIEVIPDESDPSVMRYRTKGDNNETPDGEAVHSKNVIGKPIFTIPYLGYLANFVQTSPGRYIALGACLVLLVLIMFGDNKTDKTETKPTETETPADPPEEKTEDGAEGAEGEHEPPASADAN